MKQKRVNKSAMATRVRTSRAAIHRLLDPENTSVTLATLNRAAPLTFYFGFQFSAVSFQSLLFVASPLSKVRTDPILIRAGGAELFF